MPIPTDGKGTAFIQALIRELRGVKEIMPNQEPESRYSRYSREELEKLLERGLSSHEQKLILDELSNRFTQELLDKVGLKTLDKTDEEDKSSKRYQSASEVLTALNSQTTVVQSPPASPSRRKINTQPGITRRNWLKYSGIGMVVGLSAIVAAVLGNRDNGNQVKLSPSPSLSDEPITLKSPKGIDYSKLQQLLAAGKWTEADEETDDIMLAAAGREKLQYLRLEDINNFPCEDLRTINQLWLHYSNGKFGFSVQKEIYESLGGTRDYNEAVLEKFGDRVGWRKGGSWLDYDELTFNVNAAPKAHLPGVFWRVRLRWRLVGEGVVWGLVGGGGVGFSSLAQRLVTCSATR